MGGTSTFGKARDVLQLLNKQADELCNGNEKMRDDLIKGSLSLLDALETPEEKFMRTLWASSVHPVALRVASDMRLFNGLQTGGGKAMTSVEIAKAACADLALTEKLLKILASIDVVNEVGVNEFAPTPFSDSLTSEVWRSAMDLLVPYNVNVNLKAIDFFNDVGHKLPTDPLDTPIQFGTERRGRMHGMDINKVDNNMAPLENLMILWVKNRPHWSAPSFYPVQERLIDGADDTDPEAVFLVDVGGGYGQDFARLLTNVPQDKIPGKLMLQDQQHVVEFVSQDMQPASFIKMSHDFLQPQPVLGARAYFMHSILHNHTDDTCKTILRRLAAAMKKGYSKLLIWDYVVPDKGAGVNVCVMDWIMMVYYGAEERTETQWRVLLEDPDIGFKITDIVHYGQYDQSLIELELK